MTQIIRSTLSLLVRLVGAITAIALVSLATLGCKQSPAPTPAPTPTPAQAPKEPTSPTPSANGVASLADFHRVGLDLIQRATVMYQEQDCDKLAAKLTAFFDTNQAAIEGMDAWQKAHPEDVGWWMKNTLSAPDDVKAEAEARLAAENKYMDTARPMLEKCTLNPANQAALKRFPISVLD
jgi:hypothetical protein